MVGERFISILSISRMQSQSESKACIFSLQINRKARFFMGSPIQTPRELPREATETCVQLGNSLSKSSVIYLIMFTTAAAASPAAAAARLLFPLPGAATALTPLKNACHATNATHARLKADNLINLVVQTLSSQSFYSNLWGQWC